MQRGSTDVATPRQATTVDLPRLKRCCRQIEAAGRAKASQEGVGLIGLAAQCDEIVDTLAERGSLGATQCSQVLDDRKMLSDPRIHRGCADFVIGVVEKCE
jgi:hypothetical protein